MTFLEKFVQVVIAVDQLIHTLVGLFLKSGAWADETLSARAHRSSALSPGWSRVEKMIDGVFFWQKAHCTHSYESEKQRVQMAPEYRPTVSR